MKNKYTIVGATSDIGKIVALRLEALGHDVKRVSRTDGVSIDDADALAGAFQGAFGAYIVIPFDMAAPDLHQRESEIGLALAAAIKTAGLRRVIFLSGLSANLHKGSSLGASIMEGRLSELGIAERIVLRCAFFMENFLKGLSFPAQASTGFYCSPFRGDIPAPMIAAKDIAQVVVSLLTAEQHVKSEVRELLGAKDYSFEEAIYIMGAAIGKPDIRYKQVSIEEGFQGMVKLGVSDSFARAVMETAESINNLEQWGSGLRTPENSTPTTLEAWAQQALKSA